MSPAMRHSCNTFSYFGSPTFFQVCETRCPKMSVNAPPVESGPGWFPMIISYLQLESMRLWFHAHPQSTIEEFEHAWPFMLNQMLWNATHVAIEQLQTICQLSLN
jgi:hypothetical protein